MRPASLLLGPRVPLFSALGHQPLASRVTRPFLVPAFGDVFSASLGQRAFADKADPSTSPSSKPPGWKDRLENKLRDTLDYEKNLERRQELIEQVKESYWKDFKELNDKGVKLFQASSRLLKAERSIYLPDLKGTSLSGKSVSLEERLRGKTSLVSFCFVAFGEPHVKSFVEPFKQTFGQKDPRIQCLQLTVEENYLKRPILYCSTPYIRRRVAKEDHDNYIHLYQRIDRLRRRLGIVNTYLGWVFLVDDQMRVRWVAQGPASPKELEDMVKLTRVLHRRNMDSLAAIEGA